MLTILFFILMAIVFGRLAYFAVKLAWSFTKVFFTIVFLPILLALAIVGGLLKLAFPLLVIIGVISLFSVK